MDMAFSYGDSFATEDCLTGGSSEECRLCGLLTVKRCQRCGDYYCCEKCQQLDWPNHRYICFPIPPLVRAIDVKYNDNLTEKSWGLQDNDTTVFKLRMIFEKLRCIEDNLNKLMNTRIETSNEANNHPMITPNDAKNDSRNESNGFRGLDASLKTSEQNITNTETEHVLLCTFRSTNRCAIRSRNPEKDTSFRAVIEQIDKYGRNAPLLKSLPKVGSYAITLKSNKQYTRVKVLSVSENHIRVMFCDFGNTVNRKLEELREISQEIINLPEYVSTIQLHNVPMFQYSEKIIDYLKTFERKEYKIKYINENGNTYAELYDLENDQLLNEVIAKFYSDNEKPLKATPMRQLSQGSANKNKRNNQKLETTAENEVENAIENVIESVIEAPFKTHIFDLNSCNLNVVVIDTNLVEFGYLSCIQKSDLSHLLKIQQYLNDKQCDTEPYEPKLNEYVIAQYENDWYRGLVVDVNVGERTKYEVSYIDFLNEATLTSDCIRRYPKDLKIDCFTTLCKIDGLPKLLKPKHREFLKSNININDFILINRVVEIVDEKIALIECDEIIKRMHEEKLM